MIPDPLQPVFEHFQIQAHTFFIGNACTVGSLGQADGHGYLHIVKAGRGEYIPFRKNGSFRISKPMLIFCPRGSAHQIVPEGPEGLDLVCATVTFRGGMAASLLRTLPEVTAMDAERLGPLVDLLCQEAFGSADGRLGIVNRLLEILLVALIREAMAQGKVKGGLLVGLGHAGLGEALAAMHADPCRPWSLEELSGMAAMSRSSFAKHFKSSLGMTPGEHLRSFKVDLAMERLVRGEPLKRVADELGYSNSSAFSRAFRKVTGASPVQWLAREGNGPGSTGPT